MSRIILLSLSFVATFTGGVLLGAHFALQSSYQLRVELEETERHLRETAQWLNELRATSAAYGLKEF